jgi:hypothetical protein
VQHDVEAPLPHQGGRLGARDARLDEARAGGQVLAPAARHVVDDRDLVPLREEEVGDMGADEAGPAGDERFLRHRDERAAGEGRPYRGRPGGNLTRAVRRGSRAAPRA